MLVRPKYFNLDRRHPLHGGSQLRLLGWQAGSIYARDGDGKPGYVKRHGTLTNMVPATNWVAGTDGRHRLQFVAASDQYVNIGNPVGLQITGPITVACWYYIPTAPASQNQLVAKDKNTGGRAYTFDLDKNVGVRFYINGGSAPPYPAANIAVENRAAANGDLRHACGTYDGAVVRAYGNGVPGVDSSSADASIPTATANVLVGRREYSGFTQPFNGFIWDVCIWNRVLSLAEIQILASPDPFYGGWLYDPTRKVIPWVSGGAATGGPFPHFLRRRHTGGMLAC